MNVSIHQTRIAYAKEAYRRYVYGTQLSGYIGHIDWIVDLQQNCIHLSGFPEGSHTIPFRANWQYA